MLAAANSPESLIGQALGHVKGARCTPVYIHAYETDIRRAFQAFDIENGEEKRGRNRESGCLPVAFFGRGFSKTP